MPTQSPLYWTITGLKCCHTPDRCEEIPQSRKPTLNVCSSRLPRSITLGDKNCDVSTVAPQKVIASPQDLGNVAVLKDYDVSTVSQHDFYLLFGDHTLAPMFSMSHSLLVPTETSSALSAHSLPEAQQQTSTDSGGVAHCHNSTMSSTELCIGGAAFLYE